MDYNNVMLRIAGIVDDSIVDGPGFRLTVFAQGCERNCPGCHNPATHDKNGGYLITAAEILAMADKNPLLDGVTFSGGEPFMQAAELALVAIEAHRIGWDVVTFTGYTYEELRDNPDTDVQALLAHTDYLIDGPYIDARKDVGLKFRGSDNQRLIDMNATRKRNRVVLFY